MHAENQTSVDSFKKSVFISHASKNFKIADEIRELLEARGINCWIAPRDIPFGFQYGTAIVEAIRECTVTLLVLTDESNHSKPVQNEIERAFSYQKTIIPLRLREVTPSSQLEFFISNAQWVNAFSTPLKNRVEQIINIVNALELNQTAPRPLPEVPSLTGTVELYLERALRHKILSSLAAFSILASLSAGVLWIQIGSQGAISDASTAIGKSASKIEVAATTIEQTSSTIKEVNSKIDQVKKETSSDPRKELANLGITWDKGNFHSAIKANDLRIVSLFLDGGINLQDDSVQGWISSMLFYKDYFSKHEAVRTLMHTKGIDFLKTFPGEGGAVSRALSTGNLKGIEWIINNNDTSILQDASYEGVLGYSIIPGQWCSDTPETLDGTRILVRYGIPTAGVYKRLMERHIKLGNPISSPKGSGSPEDQACLRYLELLKPATKNHISIEASVRAEAIKELQWMIGSLQEQLQKNSWKANDAPITLIIPGTEGFNHLSHADFKVEVARLIGLGKERIRVLQSS